VQDNLSHTKGPDTPPIRDITLGQLLAEAAAQHPERVALLTGDADPGQRRSWTYAQFYAAALTVAHALLTTFEAGERIAVWAPNIPEWLLLEFGSALAGTVLVTVNPAYQAEELTYVLKQSRSAGLFLVPAARGNPMLDHAEQVRSQCPELREIIRFDQWDAFTARAENAATRLPPVEPGDPVMIQYTSGTTGFP
jgi:fatty-acyl-CoA synthase